MRISSLDRTTAPKLDKWDGIKNDQPKVPELERCLVVTDRPPGHCPY